MIAALKITEFTFPVATHWANQVLFSFLRLLVVSGVLVPFVWLINRKSGLLSAIRAEFAIRRAAKNNSLL
jgi:hypothetical protein